MDKISRKVDIFMSKLGKSYHEYFATAGYDVFGSRARQLTDGLQVEVVNRIVELEDQKFKLIKNQLDIIFENTSKQVAMNGEARKEIHDAIKEIEGILG